MWTILAVSQLDAGDGSVFKGTLALFGPVGCKYHPTPMGVLCKGNSRLDNGVLFVSEYTVFRNNVMIWVHEIGLV